MFNVSGDWKKKIIGICPNSINRQMSSELSLCVPLYKCDLLIWIGIEQNSKCEKNGKNYT